MSFKMHLSMNARICKIIFLFLLVVHNLSVYTRAESVHVITVPKKISSSQWTWNWKATGPTGGGVDQWKNAWPNGDISKPVQYSVCDASPNTPKANQWLTSTDISSGLANRIDIIIEYAMSDCSVINNQYCRQNFSLYLHESPTQLPDKSFPNPYTNLGIFEKIGTSSPKVLTTGSLDQAQRNKETFSAMVNKPYAYLALYYQGGCVKLFSVSVQYYQCPSIKLSSNLVQLPQTIAPANNSTKVKGSCSSAQHLKPLTNESDLYGYCQDDGEWSTDRYHGECGCDYGYGKVATVSGGSECRACPLGTYSDKVSNSNCATCPLNSEQDSSRTSCDCKPNFYRTDKQTKFDSCAGQPSAPQGLSITFLNASFVTVTWSPPTDNGGRTDLYYTAECKQCNDQGTECIQECTGSNITVNQNSRLASINSLSAYTNYQLKVYAKNGVSKLAEEKNDLAKFAEYIIRTKESVPGIPVVTVKQLSSTSVLLSWEVEEKNGVITYYQVSYYPVDHPSNVKKFNTTSTNASITGLETGKKYMFQVQASSPIGLGPSASQTMVVADNQEKQRADVTVPILGTMVGILLFGIAVLVIVYFVRKRGRRRASATSSSLDQKQTVKFAPPPKDPNMNNGIVFLEGFNNPQESHDQETPESRDDLYMVVPDDANWEVPRENISVIKRLGSGNFGYVDKAIAIGLPGIPGQVMVAVKTLKENVKLRDKEDFLTELNLMMRMAPHRHVVRLYGCCTIPGGPQSIILEYLPYGDLLGYLRRSRGHEDSYCSGDLRPESRLKSKDLLRFGWMIADGMSFLADNKCVHRDLAARNVLVGENKICKISDLGLARKVSEDIYTRSSRARLPVKWMPPESIFFGQSTIASDVWAYGIVLWELFTLGDSPYPGCNGNDVTRLLREGYRMPKPPHLSKILYSLMLKCWKDKPEERPPFNTIREEINTYFKATEDYINLDVFEDSLYVNFDAL
ncbi:ephrin type-A receptor 7-like isoform X2 [Actinia tenebrosa]|nr:ephrin type-A receptor 7-like isoform X2 [Actinia tenebrosa]XP_031575450.1 ephrin type-A receptor 7-like isoform X2 [Actinia tenebrosa]